MDFIKKLWPHSFSVKAKDVGSLVVNLIVWILICVVGGVILWLATALTGWIPVIGALIGIVAGILGSLLEVYSVIGIVLSILVFLGIMKK